MKLNNIDFGRPWSGWVGLNVRELGLVLSVTGNQGDRITVRQIPGLMAHLRRYGGYFEVGWNGPYNSYNQEEVEWYLPYTGTFTIKIRYDAHAVLHMRSAGHWMTFVQGQIYKQSWYEPGRNLGMSINHGAVLPDR